MYKINNMDLMEKYIEEYKIYDIFTCDIRPYLELFMFKKNEHICRENEAIDYLLFFVKGKAKVYTTLSNGKSLLLCFYEGFRVLGDLELVNRQMATTNVQIIEDAYCLGISTERARQYLADDARLLGFICKSLGEKLYRCSKNSSINLLYPLENRLASYIIAAGQREDYSLRFCENLTEISELLGTSYRHLLRTLDALCIKGLITKKGHSYEVIDELQLRKLSADLYT